MFIYFIYFHTVYITLSREIAVTVHNLWLITSSHIVRSVQSDCHRCIFRANLYPARLVLEQFRRYPECSLGFEKALTQSAALRCDLDHSGRQRGTSCASHFLQL